jgi:hypothetical protein
MLSIDAVVDSTPSIFDGPAGLTKQNGLSTLADSPRARRRELRYPLHLPAIMRVAGSDAPVNARICDMSSFGLGLNLPIEIEPGVVVEIEFAYGTVIGEMIHCQSVTGYFRAGLAVKDFLGRGNSKK